MKSNVLLVSCLLVLAVSFFNVSAADATPFLTAFDAVGYYSYIADGLGLGGYASGTGTHSGTLGLNTSGTPEFGFLLWHGFADTGNSTPTFNGVQINGTQLTEPAGEYGIGYWADVTSFISQGNSSYTLSDVSFDQRVNGFGLVSVFEDLSSYGRLSIYEGNDRAYYGSADATQRNSMVHEYDVNPLDYDRLATITIIAGGGEDGVRYDDRRSYLWYYFGEANGELVGNATRWEEGDYQHILYARDGYDWDTFTFQLLIPANTSVLSLQMESATDAPHGESFNWLATVLFVEESIPTVPEPMTCMLMFLGAGVMGFLKRRK